MSKRIGFTCAYTPVPLIEAAGCSPFRVFPETGAPDQAGHLMHDNLCPHVKKVLDRALDGDLPELGGMVFVNSCDSMRRLADAWQEARPKDNILLIDLPSAVTGLGVEFLAGEYERLARTLFQWNNGSVADASLAARAEDRIRAWNALCDAVGQMEGIMAGNAYPGYAAGYQEVINASATESIDAALELAKKNMEPKQAARKGLAPVLVFGNLLFDPGVYDLFAAWNVHVTASDFCTSSRFLPSVNRISGRSVYGDLAASYLHQSPCARTMDAVSPGSIAKNIVRRAKESGARGVIGFTLKFCDPYLARIPMIRQALQEASIPFLMLEGDCTLGSLGQQQTRVEAFTEMLGG